MLATGNKPFSSQSLSIRIHADGFSFFVCDQQTGNLIRGEHYRLSEGENCAQRMVSALGNPAYFNHHIDQVFVLSCCPSTFVPMEEFRRDEAAALYELTFADADMKALRVAYTIMPQLEAVELYALPCDVEEAVLRYYPTARFFGAHAMLLERLLRLEESADGDARTLYVVLEGKAVSLFHLDGDNLRFANSFAVQSEADALYFILYVWKTLGLQAETDHLCILTSAANDGQSDVHASQLQSSLAEYLRHVVLRYPAELFPRVPLTGERQVPLDLMALLLNRL